jgi:hypothetical protein
MMSVDIDSRVAVRGGLRLHDFTLNSQSCVNGLPPTGSARFGVVVQGPGVVDLTEGSLACGSLLVSTDVAVASLPAFTSPGTGLVVSRPLYALRFDLRSRN